MQYYNIKFPFYGKLENDDELYIACYYHPDSENKVAFDELNRPYLIEGDTSFIPNEINQRLSFLSYLPLKITLFGTNPIVYTTKDTMLNKFSFDLQFTPAYNNASIFKVKNVCGNNFELYFNNQPVFLSTPLIQADSGEQVEVSGNMFTLANTENKKPQVYQNPNYDFGTFYGVFFSMNGLFLNPVYKKGCVSQSCDCTSNPENQNCCIPDLISSLNISDLCDKQMNSMPGVYDIILIPKKTKYASISGIIYEDNNTLYNFIYTWDTIINNKGQSSYVYYSSSLFKNLDYSKRTINLNYCRANQLCGFENCYGSCSSDCKNNTKSCYDINFEWTCSSDAGLIIKPPPIDVNPSDEIGGFNLLTIITIIFGVLLIISVIVFIVVIFKRSQKRVGISSVYNVNVYES